MISFKLTFYYFPPHWIFNSLPNRSKNLKSRHFSSFTLIYYEPLNKAYLLTHCELMSIHLKKYRNHSSAFFLLINFLFHLHLFDFTSQLSFPFILTHFSLLNFLNLHSLILSMHSHFKTLMNHLLILILIIFMIQIITLYLILIFILALVLILYFILISASVYLLRCSKQSSLETLRIRFYG